MVFMEKALAHPDVPGFDTVLARFAIILQRCGLPDSARIRFHELLGAFSGSAWVPVAHLYLGEDLSESPVDRVSHLTQARLDSGLAKTALSDLANLLEQQGRFLDAADTLAVLLRLRTTVADSVSLARLANLAQMAHMDPDTFQTRLESIKPLWADTLYLAQARLTLKTDLHRGMEMLAAFQIRFPVSSLSAASREMLARARRNDPQLLGR